MKPSYIDEFTRAYLEAMAFTDAGPDDEIEPGDPLAFVTLRQVARDCRAFCTQNRAHLLRADAQTAREAGHDFWLTRNGHGAGFWDRGLPDPLGDVLTDAATAFGEIWPYLGDDEFVYFG